jgi:hypothetical protein
MVRPCLAALLCGCLGTRFSYDAGEEQGRTRGEEVDAVALELLGTSPTSPSSDNVLRVLGTATEGAVIDLFAVGCAGDPLAAGTAEDLQGSGIQIVVTENSASALFGRATLEGASSACAPGPIFIEDSIAPALGSISAVSETQSVLVTWEEADDEGSATFEYDGCIVPVGEECTGNIIEGVLSPWLTTNLLERKRYHVGVRAIDGAGNESDWSMALVQVCPADGC